MAFILIFLSISIFISDINVVGKIGSLVSQYSKEYLGYIAYGYLLFFLYVLYKFNFYVVKCITIKISTIILLFISLILFQSLVIDGPLSGKIGNILVENISPFVGLAGLWIFVIIGFILSFVLLVETDDLLDVNTSKMKEQISSFFKFSYPKNKIKSLPPKLSRSNEQKVTVKEVGDTAEIYIDDDEEMQHPVFSKIQESEVEPQKEFKNNVQEEVIDFIEEIKPPLQKTENKVEEEIIPIPTPITVKKD